MGYLLSFAILSLFTPLKIATPLVQVRPFDALTGLALLLAFARGKTFPRGGPPLGLVILLPYFTWHVISALGVSPANGVREGLQLATVVAFAWAVSVELDDLDYRQIGRLLLVGMTVITIWSIGWHIANGYWSGWKRLLDPKSTFTFLPLVLGCVLVAGDAARRRFYWICWLALGAVIFMSGERKALVVFGILSATMIARGRILSSLHVIAAAFVALVLVADLVDDPYLSRQLRTVVSPVETGDFSTAIATGEAALGDTRSNAQRSFAMSLARELISQNLLLGVGTNAYERIIATRFAYLPEFLLSGIHGEFLRVLTENGLLGLLTYVLIWLTAALRTRSVLNQAVRQDLLVPSQASLLQIATFAPCLLYVSFEGSGTHSLIVLAFISLLPDGLRAWLAPAREVTPLPAMRPPPRPYTPRGPTPANWRGSLGTSS
jgi:hypothetical protein